MNAYYKVTSKIRELLIADPDVNTVTKGKADEIDTYKATMFPLAHVSVIPSSFSKREIRLSFSINALSIRDKDNIPVVDKYIGEDNEDDNLNAMLYVLLRLYLQLDQWTVEDDFRIVGEPQITPVLYEFSNLLDGWEMTIEIGVPIEEVDGC